MSKRKQTKPDLKPEPSNGQSEASMDRAATAAREQAEAEADQAAIGRAASAGEAPIVVQTARAIDPVRARRAALATIHARWRDGIELDTIPAEAWPFVLAWLALSWRQGYEQASADALRMLEPRPAPAMAPLPGKAADPAAPSSG